MASAGACPVSDSPSDSFLTLPERRGSSGRIAFRRNSVEQLQNVRRCGCQFLAEGEKIARSLPEPGSSQKKDVTQKQRLKPVEFEGRPTDRSSERILNDNGLSGCDILGQHRITFKRIDNIVEQISKPAGVCQANFVAREHNIAIDADMRRPVLYCETIQGDGLRLILIGMNKTHASMASYDMR